MGSKYAHLEYEVLEKLEISIAEYWYLDMVYQLSRDSYCYKSLENIAKDMRITVNGVVKMRERLKDRGLLLVKKGNKVRTSVKYNSVCFSGKTTTTQLQKYTTEYKSDIQLSINKNNNKTNKERVFNLNEDKRGEYSPAKEALRAKWSKQANA